MILEDRKSLTPLLKLEILEACRTESGNTFHVSTILLKKHQSLHSSSSV